MRYAETDRMGVVYYANYEVARGADGTIAAVGHTVHAAVDTTGKPCRLPSRVREVLA